MKGLILRLGVLLSFITFCLLFSAFTFAQPIRNESLAAGSGDLDCGNLFTGNLDATNISDDIYLYIKENATNCGIEFYANFSGLNSLEPYYKLGIEGGYVGGASNNLNVFYFNHITNDWKEIIEMPYVNEDTIYLSEFLSNDNSIGSGDSIGILFNHTEPPLNPNYSLLLDKVWLEVYTSNVTTTTTTTIPAGQTCIKVHSGSHEFYRVASCPPHIEDNYTCDYARSNSTVCINNTQDIILQIEPIDFQVLTYGGGYWWNVLTDMTLWLTIIGLTFICILLYSLLWMIKRNVGSW